MTQEIIDALIHIAELIGAAIIGGLIVALVSHKLTLGRERTSGRAARKREFLAFMRAWRIEVDRTYLEVGGFARHPSSLTGSVSSFSAAAELIRGDFTGDSRKKFERLIAAVTSCNASNFDNTESHRRLLKAFDDIIAYVDAAEQGGSLCEKC
jgi:hypothetical protein